MVASEVTGAEAANPLLMKPSPTRFNDTRDLI
jgi:hypothetical protein